MGAAEEVLPGNLVKFSNTRLEMQRTRLGRFCVRWYNPPSTSPGGTGPSSSDDESDDSPATTPPSTTSRTEELPGIPSRLPWGYNGLNVATDVSTSSRTCVQFAPGELPPRCISWG